MTKADKIEFVTNLTGSVRDELIKKIESGQVPEDWDGHELRELIAEKFASETTTPMKKGRRRKDYKNAVIVNNL